MKQYFFSIENSTWRWHNKRRNM